MRATAVALAILLGNCVALAQTVSAAWRYDLRPGDRLVYEQTFTREIAGPDMRAKTEARFINNVVVAAANGQSVTVGFERDRVAAELLLYRQKGQDRLNSERARFAERLARQPAVFAEANEVTPHGESRALWQAVREASSRVLAGLHEIEALPANPVKVGDRWEGGNVIRYRFQFTGTETVAGEACAVVAGEAPDAAISLRYWFCPPSGVVRRMEFEARYATVGGEAHETVSIQLKEKRRDETLQSWLASPGVQQAALRAILQSNAAPFTPAMLAPCIRSADSRTQALALAVLYRAGVSAVSLSGSARDLLPALAKSGDADVARLAARVLAGDLSRQPAPRFKEELPGAFLRPMTRAPYEGSPYILQVPLDYRGDEPFPLLVMLSGGPGLAVDGANAAQSGIGGLGYLVLYPSAGGRMWWEPEVAKTVDALLDEVGAQFNIDRTRVYITGFSNGGTGALYYASLWPSRFRAAASLMGAADCVAAVQMHNLDAVPVLFVHGDKDRIIPMRCSADAYKKLSKHATNKQLEILPGREHDITPSTDGGIAARFFEKYGGMPAGGQNQPLR